MEGSQRDVLCVDLVRAEVEALQFQPSDLAIAEDSPVRDSQFMEPNSGNQMPAADSRKRDVHSIVTEPRCGYVQVSYDDQVEPAIKARPITCIDDDKEIRNLGPEAVTL